MDRSDDTEDRIWQLKIGMKQKSLNNKLTSQNTSDYGSKLIVKMPQQIKSNLPHLHLLPLKREENLRTYSRRPKNKETPESATSEVIFLKKCTALDINTNVICGQDKIMQCTDIAVKLENNTSDDTVIENIKREIVSEDYNKYNCCTTTGDKSIENMLPLQDEVIKEAEEIIKLSCSREYDDDTLNFVREQLYQVVKVLKSAK